MTGVMGIVGWHNSGKTTIVSQVIRILCDQGFKVGVLKSAHQKNLIPDEPGTDTDLYSKSGATGVGLACPDQFVLRLPRQEVSPFDLARAYFPSMDIVLAEGFKSASDLPKIEVNRTGKHFLFHNDRHVVALVSDSDISGIRRFAFHEVEKLTGFIVSYLKEIKA